MNRGLLFTLLIAGCAATETGNPVAQQQLALTAITNAPEEVALDSTTQAPLVVEQAWVVLGDVRFVQAARCDGSGGDNADIEGPTVVDLLGEAEPLELAIEETTYCRVRVPLERADELPGDAPSALADHSILITGQLDDGTPFVVRSRDTREAEVRSRADAFRLDRAQAGLVLAFDVAAWLRGVDLASAERDADGAISVDERSNDELLDVFEDNVERALELFRDLDEDGRLDEDERASPLASGEP